MSRFDAFLLSMVLMALAGSLAATAPMTGLTDPTGAANNPFMNGASHAKSRDVDKNALRDEVDETQSLFDSLARETRRVDKAAKEELLKSLRMDYALPEQEGAARKQLDKMEEVLDIQDAIRAQQLRMKGLSVGAEMDKAEQKLFGLQSDLVATVEDLRKMLSDQQKDLTEAATRDYRNWLMVSEGLLRNRREDAEAKAAASPAPEAAPLSAAGVTPSADADDQPVAAPPAPQPATPTAKPKAKSKAKSKAARPRPAVTPVAPTAAAGAQP